MRLKREWMYKTSRPVERKPPGSHHLIFVLPGQKEFHTWIAHGPNGLTDYAAITRFVVDSLRSVANGFLWDSTKYNRMVIAIKAAKELRTYHDIVRVDGKPAAGHWCLTVAYNPSSESFAAAYHYMYMVGEEDET